MKSFLKTLLAVLVGYFLLIFIGILFLVILGAEKPKPIANNSILEFSLSGELVDRTKDDDFAGLGQLAEPNSQEKLGLRDLIKSIELAEDNDKIDGILLSFEGVFSNQAALKELRNALEEFKTSEKFIYAYGENLSQSNLYLASVADSIFVHPTGMVELSGLSATIPFLKNTLEHFGITPVVIRGSNNKFKSAVEPFIADSISEANKTQTQVFLNAFWDEMLNTISNARGVSKDELQGFANSLSILNASGAEKHKLIDGIVHKGTLLKKLAERTNQENEKPKFISYGQLLNTEKSSSSKNRVAVVFAEGDIVPGDGDNYQIGSDRLVKTLRRLRLDDRTQSVVLRVNSPGGSVLASEAIWNEVQQIAENKTLVVSMGNLAASGGYYISAPADKIYAQPNTITGSIGVFGMFFNMEKLLKDKLKMNFSTVKTADYADLGGTHRQMTDFEFKVIQKEIDHIYGGFIKKVMDGRGLDSLYIDSIAQGRVWAGIEAHKLGLVDELGGLNEAIASAAEIAGFEDDYKVVEYLQIKTFQDQLNDIMGSSSIRSYLFSKFTGINSDFLDIDKILQREGIQARLEHDYIIE